jgi:hypothetical protein
MPSPTYDIADFFPTKVRPEEGQFAVKVAHELWGRFVDEGGFQLPDSVLLEPEIVVRDACQFDSLMLSGFDSLLGYCGGPEIFARGLRAARSINAAEHVQIIEEAKQVMERHGLHFPHPLPNPWWDPNNGYYSEDAMAEELWPLDGRYYKLKDQDFYMTLLHYIYDHREELACRAPRNVA